MERTDEQLLDGYFSRQLTAAEKADLQNRRANNPDLDADFILGEKIGHTYAKNEQQRLKKLLQQEETALQHRENMVPVTGGGNSTAVWIKGILAIAVVLIPLVIYFWPKPQTPETLFADAFVVPENRLRAAGAGSDDIEQMRQQASGLYDQKEYTKAADVFGQLAIRQPDQPAMHYYQGVSLLASGQFEAAIVPLEQTIRIGQSNYYGSAHWYLALAQLRNGQQAAAISSIKIYLQERNPVYLERATALLKALEGN